MTLSEARRKAGLWLDLIAQHIDPADEAERRKRATAENRRNTCNAVFDDWKRDKLSGERRGEETARDFSHEILPALGPKPITEITDLDILAIINVKKRTAPVYARNLLSYSRRFFQWAIDQRLYGITRNPCDGLKPGRIIGQKRKRQRVLTDDELFALWRAVKRLPYPYRQAYQLLMLTALRLNEVGRASWDEFHEGAIRRALRQRRDNEPIAWNRISNELAWIVPAERMKGRNETALPHLVPLTADLLKVLETLPLFKGGYLFSLTGGKTPAILSSKVKARIDARMLRTMKALARLRGDDAAAMTLAQWGNHDIRRSVRTRLSRLRVTEEAREAVLAHARPGIKGVYDVHTYADEKREALELWAARLRSIVEPPPKVVRLRTAAA